MPVYVIFLSTIVILTIVLLVTIMSFLLDEEVEEVLTNYHRILLMVGSGLLICILLSPVSAYTNVTLGTSAGFFANMLVTVFYLKRYQFKLKAWQITTALVSGSLFIETLIRTFSFYGSLGTLPDSVVIMLGIFAGYSFFYRRRMVNMVNLGLYATLMIFMCSYGFDLWSHKLGYGNFTGDVSESGPAQITVLTKEKGTINIKNGKLTVLDFWFVGCGSCMEEFPRFQKTYSTYKNNSDVQFYSVNVPISSDSGIDKFKFLSRLNYSFPMAISTDQKLTTDLGIKVYPTVVILNENGNVVYKGDAKGMDSKLKALL